MKLKRRIVELVAAEDKKNGKAKKKKREDKEEERQRRKKARVKKKKKKDKEETQNKENEDEKRKETKKEKEKEKKEKKSTNKKTARVPHLVLLVDLGGDEERSGPDGVQVPRRDPDAVQEAVQQRRRREARLGRPPQPPARRPLPAHLPVPPRHAHLLALQRKRRSVCECMGV